MPQTCAQVFNGGLSATLLWCGINLIHITKAFVLTVFIGLFVQLQRNGGPVMARPLHFSHQPAVT